MHLYNFMPQAPTHPLFLDGTDGQEDELDDVRRGILNPPTNTEGPGSIDEPNKRERTLQSEDEDDEEARGVISQDDEDALRRDRANFPQA